MVLYILCVLTNEWWLVATIIVSYRIVPQLLKSSVLHLSIPASTQASGNHRSFFVTVITVLPFPECHTCCCSVLSCVQLFVTPWTAEHQASLSFTISQSLLKPTCIETMMPSDHLNIYHPLFLCPPSFPASGSFPMSQLFASVGQNIGASSSASALPVNIQGWFPLGLTGWMSLQSKGFSRVLQHHNSKASIIWHLPSLLSNSHIHTRLLEKP